MPVGWARVAVPIGGRRRRPRALNGARRPRAWWPRANGSRPKKHGIFASIFTDADLKDMDKVWAYITDFLRPKEVMAQMNLHLRNNFFKNKKKQRG